MKFIKSKNLIALQNGKEGNSATFGGSYATCPYVQAGTAGLFKGTGGTMGIFLGLTPGGSSGTSGTQIAHMIAMMRCAPYNKSTSWLSARLNNGEPTGLEYNPAQTYSGATYFSIAGDDNEPGNYTITFSNTTANNISIDTIDIIANNYSQSNIKISSSTGTSGTGESVYLGSIYLEEIKTLEPSEAISINCKFGDIATSW